MKNILLHIYALIGIISTVRAQQTIFPEPVKTKTSAGRWVIGLETENLFLLKKVAGSGDDFFLRKIAPTVGFAVTPNLVVGLGIPLGWAPQKGTYYSNGTVSQAGIYSTYISPKQVGVSPFIQQFIGKGKIKPYVGVAYRYTYQQLDLSIRELSVYLKQPGNESELSVFAGLTYFITPRFGIDAKFRYGWQQGNHPYIIFPNRSNLGYSATFAYSGQTGSANVGFRYQLGR
ncbi:hypothetical protein [Spirosoma fluminis]